MIIERYFEYLLKYMKDPKLFILFAKSRGLLNWMSDEKYLKFMYKIIMERNLELNNPKTFNEKLQWLKLNDRQNYYVNLVDKYKVREHISSTIGEEYLIPLLGVWDNFDDIDFTKLPNKFVLKCNHDSGGIVICEDKNKLDINLAKKKINKSLKRNYYNSSREWPYKNVKPKILCEKYMEDKVDKDLKDYKFMCFNGEVKCVFICSNRGKDDGLKVDFYDRDWNFMNVKRHYPNSGIILEKPKNFEEMLKLSEILAKDTIFVRIDFYEINGKIYFGEFTLYPGAGFEEFTPEEYDYLLGSWIKLPLR